MTFKDLIPFGKKTVPASRDEEHPFLSLRREMDRVFDDFFRDLPIEPFGGRTGAFSPRLDIAESGKEFRITMELPGMDEKDVDVALTKDALTIRGEKKDEHEEKNGSYYRMERSFGSFSRSIPLPFDVDPDKVSAAFKKGILTISLPRTAPSEDRMKKIAVRTE